VDLLFFILFNIKFVCSTTDLIHWVMTQSDWKKWIVGLSSFDIIVSRSLKSRSTPVCGSVFWLLSSVIVHSTVPVTRIRFKCNYYWWLFSVAVKGVTTINFRVISITIIRYSWWLFSVAIKGVTTINFRVISITIIRYSERSLPKPQPD